MKFENREVEFQGKRKLVKVDKNNVPIPDEEPMLVNIVKDEDPILVEGTPISADNLNKGNWRDDDSLSFESMRNNDLPAAEVNKTQLVTTQDGKVWVIPPLGRDAVSLANTVGTTVLVNDEPESEIKFSTDPQKQINDVKTSVKIAESMALAAQSTANNKAHMDGDGRVTNYPFVEKAATLEQIYEKTKNGVSRAWGITNENAEMPFPALATTDNLRIYASGYLAGTVNMVAIGDTAPTVAVGRYNLKGWQGWNLVMDANGRSGMPQACYNADDNYADTPLTLDGLLRKIPDRCVTYALTQNQDCGTPFSDLEATDWVYLEIQKNIDKDIRVIARTLIDASTAEFYNSRITECTCSIAKTELVQSKWTNRSEALTTRVGDSNTPFTEMAGQMPQRSFSTAIGENEWGGKPFWSLKDDADLHYSIRQNDDENTGIVHAFGSNGEIATCPTIDVKPDAWKLNGGIAQFNATNVSDYQTEDGLKRLYDELPPSAAQQRLYIQMQYTDLGQGTVSSLFKTGETENAYINIEKTSSTSAYITAYDRKNNRTFVCQHHDSGFTKWRELLTADVSAQPVFNVGGKPTSKLSVLTWSQYNALTNKASDTLYIIIE